MKEFLKDSQKIMNLKRKHKNSGFHRKKSNKENRKK